MLESIALVHVLVLVLSVHPLLSRFEGTHLLSFYTISFVGVVGEVIFFLVASFAISSIAVVITVFVIGVFGIGRVSFPVGSGTVVMSSMGVFVFVGGLVGFFVFFHDGEYSLVHPVLFVVEGESGVGCFFEHFSIKIMISNKLGIKIIAHKL